MEGCEIPAEDSTDIDIEMYIDEGRLLLVRFYPISK